MKNWTFLTALIALGLILQASPVMAMGDRPASEGEGSRSQERWNQETECTTHCGRWDADNNRCVYDRSEGRRVAEPWGEEEFCTCDEGNGYAEALGHSRYEDGTPRCVERKRVTNIKLKVQTADSPNAGHNTSLILFSPFLLEASLLDKLKSLRNKFPIKTESKIPLTKEVRQLPKPPWLIQSETDPVVIEKFLNPSKKLSSAVKTKEAILEAVKEYLDQSTFLEPLSLEDLQLKLISFVPGKKLLPAWYLVFHQVSDTIEVKGSHGNVLIRAASQDLEIVSLSLTLYPEAKRFSSEALLRGDQIINIAASAFEKFLGSPHQKSFVIEERVLRYVQGKWRLIAEVKPEGTIYRFHVDANSGELLGVTEDRLSTEDVPDIARDLSADAEITGNVSGMIVPSHSWDVNTSRERFPLPHLKIQITPLVGEIFTDSAGNFSFNSNDLLSSIHYELTLNGRWAQVRDVWWAHFLERISRQSALSYNDFIFNDLPYSAEPYTAEVMAYYHVNRIHDWLRQRGIGEEIDYLLPVTVNAPPSCNAFFYFSPPPPSVAFSKSGRNCVNAAYDTVIYHEYGHFVDNRIGGINLSLEGLGISEGWGDLVAAYVANRPDIYEGGYSDRRADNEYRYAPEDLPDPDPHVLGQAWSGFAWHLREGLIHRLDPDEEAIALAEELVIPVFYSNCANPHWCVWEVRQRALHLYPGDAFHQSQIATAIYEAEQRHGIHSWGYATPPLIQHVYVRKIGPGEAFIFWLTEVPSNSIVEYGIRKSYGLSAFDPTPVRRHGMRLRGLLNEDYQFRVCSMDLMGLKGCSQPRPLFPQR